MRSLAEPAVLDETLARLERISPETRPRWGIMSATQMLLHLAGAFRMAVGEVPVGERTSYLANPLGRFLVLRSGVRWPRNAPTIRELDLRQKTPAPVARFPAIRGEVAGLLPAFARCPGEQLRARHPLLGAMSRADWMRWGYLHTDHHLRQFDA